MTHIINIKGLSHKHIKLGSAFGSANVNNVVIFRLS
jgi:hypothetical protein